MGGDGATKRRAPPSQPTQRKAVQSQPQQTVKGGQRADPLAAFIPTAPPPVDMEDEGRSFIQLVLFAY